MFSLNNAKGFFFIPEMFDEYLLNDPNPLELLKLH